MYNKRVAPDRRDRAILYFLKFWSVMNYESTNDVDARCEFYQRYFSAKAVFNCGWYINLCIGGDGPTIQFMQPQGTFRHLWRRSYAQLQG
jgi:hypothetical protein